MAYLIQFCRQCAKGWLKDDIVLVHFAVKHFQHATRIKRQERNSLDLQRQPLKLTHLLGGELSRQEERAYRSGISITNRAEAQIKLVL